MSYDLAVWEGPTPEDEFEAAGYYGELYDEWHRSSDAPSVAITAFVVALQAREPDVEVKAAGPFAFVSVGRKRRDEGAYAAAQIAGEQGLVCFDPQTEQLRP